MNQDIKKSRDIYFAIVERLIAAARGSQNANDLLDDSISDLFGVNRTDSRCTDIIQRFGRMSSGELAKHCGLTSGAITTVIDRLERAGIARRVRDKKDRRKIFVELTDYTNEILALMFEPMRSAYASAMKDVSLTELRVISEYLEFTEQVSYRYAKVFQAHKLKENSSKKARLKQAKIYSQYLTDLSADLIMSYGEKSSKPPN